MRAIAMIASIALAFSVGCATEIESESEEAVVETTAVTTQSVEIQANGTWQSLGIESCFDFYQRPCSSSVPSNQCPTVVAGQPCTKPATCRRVLPGNSLFEIFRCM